MLPIVRVEITDNNARALGARFRATLRWLRLCCFWELVPTCGLRSPSLTSKPSNRRVRGTSLKNFQFAALQRLICPVFILQQQQHVVHLLT